MWDFVLKHLHDPKVYLFLQVLLVIGIPIILWRLIPGGRLFPLAIIQIFTGIALGPSLLGAIAPSFYGFLFGGVDIATGAPTELGAKVRAGIETLGNVAAVLFVFLAGCEADRQIVRKSAGTVLKIGLTGVFVPLTFGALALWAVFQVNTGMAVRDAGVVGSHGNPVLVAVAFGICMAVTALPVLVIVLRELKFNQRPIGSIAIALGGVDDAILWLAIAILLPIAAAAAVGTGALGAASAYFAVAVAGGVLSILLLVYVVTPLLNRLIEKEAPEHLLISLVFLVLFGSATITDFTGLHAALGAFLAGLLIPEKLRHLAQDKFDVPVSLLLLPFFFLSTGLKVKFTGADADVFFLFLLALFVCVGGKFLGITIPAYLSGQSLAFSTTLGVLMQCKGLMEIVVVTILFERGIIGQTLFTALVLTALVSTAMTAPLARLCERLFGDSASSTREAERVAVSVTEPAQTEAAPAPSTEIPVVPALPVAPALPVLVFDHEIGPVPMPKPDVQIGRHSEDEIRIDDVRVSRHHARLTAIGDGRFELYNQTAVRSEPNPILVNGVEKERTVLHDGDIVTIGGVNFTFREKPAATAG